MIILLYIYFLLIFCFSLNRDYNNDVNIRAASVILLHQIINQDKKFGTIFLPNILQKLEKYKNKRYFNYSYIHKIKHRIMQILLIIQPILTKVTKYIFI